ncbi:MAG: T9SS type A sorting domain-containing protein, partial [Raineya sp.]|nr:T9SS type A sorting domain-containing protein [Raineya sp.]
VGFFNNYDGNPRNSIIRLNSNGNIDNSFSGGFISAPELYALAIQPNGKILVGGNFTNYSVFQRNRIIRLNSDGSIDNDFSIGSGFHNGVVRSIALQPDGKVLVGGSFNMYNGTPRNGIARLHRRDAQNVVQSTFSMSPLSGNKYRFFASTSANLKTKFFSTNPDIADIENDTILVIKQYPVGEADIKAYHPGDEDTLPSDTIVVATVYGHGLVNSFSDNGFTQTTIYPNPTEVKFCVKTNSAIESLQLYNLQGVHQKIKVVRQKEYEWEIEIGELSQGIYFLELVTAKGKVIRKITKW